jgi:hypothetical protein
MGPSTVFKGDRFLASYCRHMESSAPAFSVSDRTCERANSWRDEVGWLVMMIMVELKRKGNCSNLPTSV